MKNTLSRKAKLFILSVLMPLSMMSIGFSSWSISAVQNVTGPITTETLQDKGTYITSCEVEYFEYMSTGFVTLPEDPSSNTMLTISDVGYLTTTLTIDLEKCRSVFSAEKLELQVELLNNKTVKDGETALSLFPYFTDATCSALGANIEFDRSAGHVLTKFQFAPSASAQSVTFSIAFKIEATETVDGKEQSVFETKVYDILQAMKTNDVSMVVQAAITEVSK